MTRHEFLAILHQVLQPKSYLEIGVQAGHSLRLAKCPAIGIDPNADHGIELSVPNATIFRTTSDKYFAVAADATRDLVFIDGDHLIEQVCRDFTNVEKFSCGEETLVVLDDVLPYNQGMAAREPCQGDWSGDAWKIWYLLNDQRTYDMRLVDVSPAGLLLVYGFCSDRESPLTPNTAWGAATQAPQEVLDRAWAISPDEAIQWVKEWSQGWGDGG